MSRGERIGGGCLLITIGAPVALVAYLFTGMAGLYGTDGWWQELLLWAVLLAALALVGWGVRLIVEQPSGKRVGGRKNGARERQTTRLERVDRELQVGDRVFHDYHGDGVVTQVMEEGWIAILFENEATELRLSPRFTSLWWADRQREVGSSG